MTRGDQNKPARDLWNSVPVGSTRSKAVPGDEQYFRDLRAYRYGYETPFIPRAFEFRRLAGRSVLEIGVGNGIDAVEMARHGAIYTGIDVTRRHLELTARYFDLAGLPAPRLVHGDLLDARFAQQFDVVYSFGVLHHIPHEREYLDCIRTLLAPGGRLLVAMYANVSFFNAYLCATWVVRNRMRVPLDHWRSHVAELSPIESPVTIRIRTRRSIESLLRASGFQVVRHQKRGFVQRYLPLIGRHLAPDGAALSLMGRLLGWYHIFECEPAGRAAVQR